MTNKEVTKEYKDLFDYATYIVKRFNKHYYNVYIKDSIDFDDLKQEAHIVVWQIIEKYKNKPREEIKKLAAQSVGWKMNLIRIKSSDMDGTCFLEDIASEDSAMTKEDIIDNMIYIYLGHYKRNPLEWYSAITFWEELQKLCTPLEFAILTKRYLEDLTLDEIIKELHLNCTKQYMVNKKDGILPRIFRKLQKYYK